MIQPPGLVVDDAISPIFVQDSPPTHAYVVLKTGATKRSCEAHLTPSEAKLVAYALLAAAERVGSK